MCHTNKRYECGSTNAERRTLLLYFVYIHISKMDLCNHHRIHTLCLSFYFAPVYLSLDETHTYTHTHSTFHAVSLRDVSLIPLYHTKYIARFFFSLLRMKFEIQTRIQNALLLLEFGCMRRCDVAGFWIFRRISCCQLLETSGNISIDK